MNTTPSPSDLMGQTPSVDDLAKGIPSINDLAKGIPSVDDLKTLEGKYSKEELEKYRKMLRDKKPPCGHCSKCGALIYMDLYTMEIQEGAQKTAQGNFLCANCAAEKKLEEKPKPGRTGPGDDNPGGHGPGMPGPGDQPKPPRPSGPEDGPRLGPIFETIDPTRPEPPTPPLPWPIEEDDESELSPPQPSVLIGSGWPGGSGGGDIPIQGSGKSKRPKTMGELLTSMKQQQSSGGSGSIADEFDAFTKEKPEEEEVGDKDILLQLAKNTEADKNLPKTLEDVEKEFMEIDYEKLNDHQISRALKKAYRDYEYRLRIDLDKEGGYIQQVKDGETVLYTLLDDGTIETTCIKDYGTDSETYIQNWIYPDGTELTRIRTREEHVHGEVERTSTYEETFDYKKDEDTHVIFGDLETITTTGIKPVKRDPTAVYETLDKTGFSDTLEGIKNSGKAGPWIP